MRKMTRAIAVAGTALTLFGAVATPAQAATPANQACLGHDISGYAKGGAAFGGFIAGLATTTQGVGTEIQAHQSGSVPDSEIPNTCNN